MEKFVMSTATTRAGPRAKISRLPEIDPFKAGERWLKDIRLTREYLVASGHAQAAHRPEAFSSIARHAAARQPRTTAIRALGRRFVVYLRRRLNAILTG
jgi:hypothetical protein